MRKWNLAIRIEGATQDDVKRGIAAAQAVFDAAGVEPLDAAAAIFKRDGEVEELTDEDCELIEVWNAADTAANVACCGAWPKRPVHYILELLPEAVPDNQTSRPSTIRFLN